MSCGQVEHKLSSIDQIWYVDFCQLLLSLNMIHHVYWVNCDHFFEDSENNLVKYSSTEKVKYCVKFRMQSLGAYSGLRRLIIWNFGFHKNFSKRGSLKFFSPFLGFSTNIGLVTCCSWFPKIRQLWGLSRAMYYRILYEIHLEPLKHALSPSSNWWLWNFEIFSAYYLIYLDPLEEQKRYIPHLKVLNYGNWKMKRN